MSQATSLFELAAELVRRHEQSAPGQVSVVPVLVEDLDAAGPVLAALAALLDGRMFDLGHRELQEPVPATDDVVRLAAITAALTSVPYGGTRSVELTAMPGGLIDASYANPPIGADPSPGERTILALARAASHEDIDRYSFAVVAYRDSTIDLPFRRAAWSLAVHHLAEMPSQSLRTLVFVAESGIDIGIHCQTGHGFQFAVDEGRLVRRRGADDLRATAAEIAGRTDPFVVFLGAGFSASSRMPLGNALRDSAIRRLLDIDADALHTSQELAQRFHGWVAPKPGWLTPAETEMREDDYVRQLTLEQVIRAERRIYPDLPTLQEFREHHDAVLAAPGTAVTDLCAILAETQGNAIIVEVNFDRLIESHATVPLEVFYSDEQFNSAADYLQAYFAGEQSAIPVLKLHGDINDLTSCVVSDEQTELGVGAGKLSALRALAERENLLWMYVGASMRDRDLLPVLRDEAFARNLDERWVAPYLVPSVESFATAREPFWRRRTSLPTIDDRIVTETADVFLAAWRTAIANRT